MNAAVTWQGLEEFTRTLDATPARLLQAAGGGLYRRAEAIMADAKEHYVPVDLGILRDSGHVELPEVTAEGVQVALGFGGAAQDYAVIQHEDLSLAHPNGGGPKYLERPLLAHGEHLLADLAEDIQAALGVTS